MLSFCFVFFFFDYAGDSACETVALAVADQTKFRMRRREASECFGSTRDVVSIEAEHW